MTFTLSPACKVLDIKMGEKKKRESNDLHRQIRIGMEMEVMLLSWPPVEAQSLRVPLVTGGLTKGAGEWLPVRLLIDPWEGRTSQDNFRATDNPNKRAKGKPLLASGLIRPLVDHRISAPSQLAPHEAREKLEEAGICPEHFQHPGARFQLPLSLSAAVLQAFTRIV
jgi:hypothetical protein